MMIIEIALRTVFINSPFGRYHGQAETAAYPAVYRFLDSGKSQWPGARSRISRQVVDVVGMLTHGHKGFPVSASRRRGLAPTSSGRAK